MRRAAVHLLVLLTVLAACGGGRSDNPTATPTSGGTATPGSSASQQPTGVPHMMFILNLTTPVSGTTSFGLYLQTDPASIGQDSVAFCGPSQYDPKPCDSANSPFSRRFTGFELGTTIVYRFERFDGPNRVQVLREGREVFGGSLTVEATYP